MILVTQETEEITILSLNRPEKRNAITIKMLKAFLKALDDLSPKTRILILKGEGSIFSAGIDLNEASDEKNARPLIDLLSEVLKRLYTLPLVTIAVVQGAALAGGAGLAAACDLTLIAEEALIGFPEVRRGLVAALVSTLLKRQISERAIRELLFTGKPIGAKRALYLGLVNHVFPHQVLMEEAMKMAGLILQGAPEAIIETKRLIEDLHPTPIEKDLQKALICNKQARTHWAAEEGIQAFKEKRSPRWSPKLEK